MKTPGRIRRRVLPGLVLLALFACEGDGPGPEAAPADAGPSPAALARLQALVGQVTLTRAGQARPASEEPLYAKDVVETAEGAQVELHFADGRVVEVGPDARITLGEDATGLLIEVARGIILSRVPRGAKAAAAQDAEVAIRILTPFGLTRVGAGPSEVKVDVAKDEATVAVVVGDVEWVARNGEAVAATAGQTLRLTGGGATVEGGGEVVTLEPIQVTVYADGRAEVKKEGERRWRRVGKKGRGLGEGDQVRVRAGTSRIALEGTGSGITLATGAQLTLGKTGRSGGRERAALALQKGELDLVLANGKKSTVTVGELELESDGGGYFHVQKTRDGLAVSARTGDLVLRRGEATKAVRAGERAVVGRKGVAEAEVRARSLPDLVLPSRAGIRVYHPGVARALIDWRGETGDYRVRVARDPRFERLVLQGEVHQSHVEVELPRRGNLYWEVRSARGEEVDSGSGSFAPEPRLRDLERLRNEVPEGPDKTTIYYQDKPPAVTFTFGEQEGAASYKLAVFRQNQLERPVVERKVTQTTVPLEAGKLKEGRYLWSVTPLGKGGAALRGGRMNKLDLVYDNSVPTLQIRAPRNGTRAGRRVRTSGVAPVGTRLFVNGKAVPLDEKSRFDLQVAPVGRPPLLVYRLDRPGASDSYYVRVLRRSGR